MRHKKYTFIVLFARGNYTHFCLMRLNSSLTKLHLTMIREEWDRIKRDKPIHKCVKATCTDNTLTRLTKLIHVNHW